MPAGWFTEPVRAWWPGFVSDLCTPGPLSFLTPQAIYADKRAEVVQRITQRGYRFRRLEGRIGAAERIWTHLRERGGAITEAEATAMADCNVGVLKQMLHPALTARVLVRRETAAGVHYELGPVTPALG